MLKIDIISGFLGAGKTTFIERLLKTEIKNEKVVLVENEYGEVSVDTDILKDTKIERHIYNYENKKIFYW